MARAGRAIRRSRAPSGRRCRGHPDRRRGRILRALSDGTGQAQNALSAYEQALTLKPEYPEASTAAATRCGAGASRGSSGEPRPHGAAPDRPETPPIAAIPARPRSTKPSPATTALALLPGESRRRTTTAATPARVEAPRRRAGSLDRAGPRSAPRCADTAARSCGDPAPSEAGGVRARARAHPRIAALHSLHAERRHDLNRHADAVAAYLRALRSSRRT